MAYKNITNVNVDGNTLYVGVDGRPTTPDKALGDWLGRCLGVATAAFGGVANVLPTAQAAWDAADGKHAGRDFPQGVYFPIFWQITAGQWKGLGHVAVGKLDGGNLTVWSSPYTHKADFDVFAGDKDDVLQKIANIYFGGNGSLLGWAEVVGGTRLLEVVPDPVPEPAPTPTPAPQPEPIKVGDTVVPIALVSYDGVELVQYDDNYTVTEVIGSRAVLTARGQTWAAVHVDNLRKV